MNVKHWVFPGLIWGLISGNAAVFPRRGQAHNRQFDRFGIGAGSWFSASPSASLQLVRKARWVALRFWLLVFSKDKNGRSLREREAGSSPSATLRVEMTARKARTTAKANAGISPLRVRKERERSGRDDRVRGGDGARSPPPMAQSARDEWGTRWG